MTKRRHRNPWVVETVPAREIAAGDRVVLDGFDFVADRVEADGLRLGDDGEALSVRLDLVHPAGRRGRPRRFAPPPPLSIDRDAPVVRVAGGADWRGF